MTRAATRYLISAWSNVAIPSAGIDRLRSLLTDRTLLAFAALVLLGTALRMLVNTTGFSSDVATFFKNADGFAGCALLNCYMDLNDSSQILARNTVVVPQYGPLSQIAIFYPLQIARYIGTGSIEEFHTALALTLTVFDVIIAWVLMRQFGVWAAAIYLLSPVAIMLTGFHSQVDGIAIAFGLISVATFKRHRGTSMVALAVSLAVKQTFILFPIWILFASDAGRIRERIRYSATVYLLLFLILLPIVIAPGKLSILYRSWTEYTVNGYGLANSTVMLEAFRIFLPEVWLNKLDFMPSILKALFGISLLGSGFLIARRTPVHLLPFYYLIMLTAFTPRLAIQYLIIPLAAVAVFRTSKVLWAYHAVAAFFIFMSTENFTRPLMEDHYGFKVFFKPYAKAFGNGDMFHPQLWLVFFAALVIVPLVLRSGRPSIPWTPTALWRKVTRLRYIRVNLEKSSRGV